MTLDRADEAIRDFMGLTDVYSHFVPFAKKKDTFAPIIIVTHKGSIEDDEDEVVQVDEALLTDNRPF